MRLDISEGSHFEARGLLKMLLVPSAINKIKILLVFKAKSFWISSQNKKKANGMKTVRAALNNVTNKNF